MIQRCAVQAFCWFEGLLEVWQAQAEHGSNAVYRFWQRRLTEREQIYRQLMDQARPYR